LKGTATSPPAVAAQADYLIGGTRGAIEDHWQTMARVDLRGGPVLSSRSRGGPGAVGHRRQTHGVRLPTVGGPPATGSGVYGGSGATTRTRSRGRCPRLSRPDRRQDERLRCCGSPAAQRNRAILSGRRPPRRLGRPGCGIGLHGRISAPAARRLLRCSNPSIRCSSRTGLPAQPRGPGGDWSPAQHADRHGERLYSPLGLPPRSATGVAWCSRICRTLRHLRVRRIAPCRDLRRSSGPALPLARWPWGPVCR